MSALNFAHHTVGSLDGLLRNLGDARYRTLSHLECTAWRTPEPVPFKHRTAGEHLGSLGIGDRWGGLWDCAWFKFSGTVPAHVMIDKCALLLDVNGEMCVYDGHGCPARGLTNISSEFDTSLGMPGKRVLPLDEAEMFEDGSIEVWADAACNDLFGVNPNPAEKDGILREAQLVLVNEEISALYYDFELLLDWLKVLPINPN
eukprot:SAG31_NODE_13411_length_871_cov_1.059585_1_plen_202_part_00